MWLRFSSFVRQLDFFFIFYPLPICCVWMQSGLTQRLCFASRFFLLHFPIHSTSIELRVFTKPLSFYYWEIWLQVVAKKRRRSASSEETASAHSDPDSGTAALPPQDAPQTVLPAAAPATTAGEAIRLVTIYNFWRDEKRFAEEFTKVDDWRL